MIFGIQVLTKYSIRDRKHILKLCFLIPNLRKKEEKPYPMGTYYKRGKYRRFMRVKYKYLRYGKKEEKPYPMGTYYKRGKYRRFMRVKYK